MRKNSNHGKPRISRRLFPNSGFQEISLGLIYFRILGFHGIFLLPLKILLGIFFLFFSLCLNAQKSKTADDLLAQINLEQIAAEQGQVHYDLNDIIQIIEDSIRTKKRIAAPKDALEFEKALFVARRVQHNDSQLVAVKLFRYLLEFKCYRNIGEELYIEYLLANSLNYLGAPLIAKHYFNQSFPELLNHLDKTRYKSYFLSHYGRVLLEADSLEQAKKTYFKILKLNLTEQDPYWICSAQNNYGYVLKLLEVYDSAKYYFRKNQGDEFKSVNQVMHAFAFGNYGSILFLQGDLDSCIWYGQKEIQLLHEVPTTEGLINAYIVLADAYELKNRFDSSYKYLSVALDYAKANNDLIGKSRIYENLLRLHSKTSNDSEWSLLLKEHLEANDSLKSYLSYETNEAEIQLTKFLQIIDDTVLSKQVHDQLLRKNRDLLYLSILLCIVLLILISFIFFRKNNRRVLADKNKDLKQKNEALKVSNEVISESNQKNEVLLKELHHRVKNNLQIISSLFNLQINAHSTDSNISEVFRDAQDRIHSISLVHKQIYQSDNFSQLDFGKYLRVFTKESATMNLVKFQVNIDIPSVVFPIDNAIPLGLIFNELFINSIKHAKAKSGLQIEIQHQTEGELHRFVYSDNGVGISKDQVDSDSDSRIGLNLIRLLSQQLNANISFQSPSENQQGFFFTIEGSFDS